MVISRPIMMTTGTARSACDSGAGGDTARSTSAALTMILSATGSRNAPRTVTAFICTCKQLHISHL